MVNGSNGPEQSRGRKPPVLASVLSALLSGMAAGGAKIAFFKAVGHLSDDNIKNIVAGLAALATLLTTTTVGGGAGRKWPSQSRFARPDRAPESHLVGSISEFGKNRTVRPNIANTGTACSAATILKTQGFESHVSKNAVASSRAATVTDGAGAAGFSRLIVSNSTFASSLNLPAYNFSRIPRRLMVSASTNPRLFGDAGVSTATTVFHGQWLVAWAVNLSPCTSPGLCAVSDRRLSADFRRRQHRLLATRPHRERRAALAAHRHGRPSVGAGGAHRQRG